MTNEQPEYYVESAKLTDSKALQKAWLDLQQRADCSYFQSWGWIGTWLDQIVVDLQPVVVKVWLNGKVVGLGVFVSRDINRRGIFHSRAMFLNEYPFDGRNMVIEYNGMLAEQGHEDAVYFETAHNLLRENKGHDEFCFGSVVEDSIPFSPEQQRADGVNCIINEESTAWSVDLTCVPAGIEGYLSSLSRNRRGQIRRSIREYEHDGPLLIEEASNTEQALHYFDRLKVLHSDYWQLRGQSGSFAKPLWERFHRALIRQRFASGEIQLLKVSSHFGEVGYIYNIVFNKHVYVIQTGFEQSDNKHLMPGYVAHTLAIAHNKEKEMAVYDLMHGDTLYKRILCNQSKKLIWVVLQRKRFKFVVEKIAVDLARYIKSIAMTKT